MPYVTERWPGGMLTNFATIRKAVRKMTNIDKLDGTSDSYTTSVETRTPPDCVANAKSLKRTSEVSPI
jgi:ribosomal protein S2